MRALQRLRQRHCWTESEALWRTLSPSASSANSCSGSGSSGHYSHARLCGLAAGVVLAANCSKQDATKCDENAHGKGDETGHHEKVRLIPKDLEHLLEPSADNPIPVSLPPPMPGLGGHQWSRYRHVAPIFGLPMRGKTYLGHELRRYIEFFHGARAKVFDINKYLGPDGDDELYADLVRFFEADAEESEAEKTLEPPGLVEIVEDTKANYSGGFAIISASDTVESTGSIWSAHTKFNRRWMAKTLEKQLGALVWFIQVTVEDSPEARHYMEQLALRRGKTLEETQRVVSEYDDHYVPIQADEKKTPFIQIVNFNEAVVVNRIMQTFVGSRVCQFLSNTHPYQHTFYLSRHGESEYNVEKRLGGNSSVSSRGREYARRCGEFSKYVVAGHCTNLVCVTLTQTELQSLHERVTTASPLSASSPGLYAKGSWTDFGDASGAAVVDGMQLVRLQPGYGKDFVDAPLKLEELVSSAGKGSVTLVFVEGDPSRSISDPVPARLWHSSLNRTIETAAFIPHPLIPGPDGKPWHQMAGRVFRGLDEIYAGIYDGWTEKEIGLKDPQLVQDRKRDKLGFRYPRGESYYDIIGRLDDVMTNLERIRDPILIVSHQAVLRLILAWFMEVRREDALVLTFPQHAVMRFSFDGLGAQKAVTTFVLGPTSGWNSDGQANL